MLHFIVSCTSGQASCTTSRRCVRIGCANSAEFAMYASTRGSRVPMDGLFVAWLGERKYGFPGQWDSSPCHPSGARAPVGILIRCALNRPSVEGNYGPYGSCGFNGSLRERDVSVRDAAPRVVPIIQTLQGCGVRS